MNCKVVMIACKAQILSVSGLRLNNEIQDRRLHLQNIERIGKKFTCRHLLHGQFRPKTAGKCSGAERHVNGKRRHYITLSASI